MTKNMNNKQYDVLSHDSFPQQRGIMTAEWVFLEQCHRIFLLALRGGVHIEARLSARLEPRVFELRGGKPKRRAVEPDEAVALERVAHHGDARGVARRDLAEAADREEQVLEAQAFRQRGGRGRRRKSSPCRS